MELLIWAVIGVIVLAIIAIIVTLIAMLRKYDDFYE